MPHNTVCMPQSLHDLCGFICRNEFAQTLFFLPYCMSHPFELTPSWFLGFTKKPQVEHTSTVQYSTIPDSGISMYFFICWFILEVDCQLAVMKKRKKKKNFASSLIFHGNSESLKKCRTVSLQPTEVLPSRP